ncbi:MAG TPA: hypothetical protein VL400_22455 [Polyangiaceae bacterium]|nr:hypothetical protein [Polyangiaceae bacterium]
MRTQLEPPAARDAAIPWRAAVAWLGKTCALVALAWTLACGSLGASTSTAPAELLLQRAHFATQQRLDASGRTDSRRASRRSPGHPAEVEASRGESPLATHDGEHAADRACAANDRAKSHAGQSGLAVLPDAARWRTVADGGPSRPRSVEIRDAFHAAAWLRESVPDPRGPPARA